MISFPYVCERYPVSLSASAGFLRCVALVKTDVSDELNASIIRVTRTGELGKLAVTSNRHTLRRNTFSVASYG
jgi:hypothetical protein